MGQHTTSKGSGGRRSSWLIALIVAAVVAVAATAVGWDRGLFSAMSDTAAAPPCEQPTLIRVAADPSIALALTTVAASFDENNCSRTTVRSEPSATTSTALARGGSADVNVWVPDSTVWLDRTVATAGTSGGSAPELEPLGVVATSPLVFAVPERRADEIAGADPGWASLADGDLRALLPDPTESAPSLVGLLALRSKLSPTDPRQFAGAVIALGNTIPPTAADAFDDADDASVPTMVVTTEQSVVARNADDPAAPSVRAVYPADGTLSAAYPFVRTGMAAQGPDVSAFRQAVLDAGPTLGAAGFRDGAGGGELDASGVQAAPVPAPPGDDTETQTEILRTWGVLTLRSRILTVIDVSGSMLQDAGGGLRRIDVFQRAAAGTLGQFPPDSEMGVWIFSTERDSGEDWEDLSPIAPLGDPAHSLDLKQIIGSLPERIRGGTGLYDTTLAAVRRVRENFDPEKENTVLLITDGRNEDDAGLDLPTLLRDLTNENDPERPVRVVMIGFGPDTDLDAMRQITDATGGQTYSATEPADLGKVLVDALAQR